MNKPQGQLPHPYQNRLLAAWGLPDMRMGKFQEKGPQFFCLRTRLGQAPWALRPSQRFMRHEVGFA